MNYDEMLTVIEAAKAGKPLEFKRKGSTAEWRAVEKNADQLNFADYRYRVKPEPLKKLHRCAPGKTCVLRRIEGKRAGEVFAGEFFRDDGTVAVHYPEFTVPINDPLAWYEVLTRAECEAAGFEYPTEAQP